MAVAESVHAPIRERLSLVTRRAKATRSPHERWHMNKAPWKDFTGGDIYEGDVIDHPHSGERGTVVFLPEYTEPEDQWRVFYGDSFSRLCLQIGDKGQAVVVARVTQPQRGEHADQG